jgi:hypothetical protein
MSVSMTTALVVLHLAVGDRVERVVQPSLAAIVVPHLAVGDMTEQEMAPYVWTMLGLCNTESGTARETCEWTDDSPHCQARLLRRLPCDRARFMRRIWQYYEVVPGFIFQ